MKDTLSAFGLFHQAVRVALFGTSKRGERPAYDPKIPLEENIRLQLQWKTRAAVALMTHGRDAFIFELARPADHIARVAIREDAHARIVMEKERDFSDWIRIAFPNDANRFALVEKTYKIFLDEPAERDVHEEHKSNKGNLTQNLEMDCGFSPKFMARAWLRIIKPVVLVFGRRKLVHGDIKPDNILVELTPDGDYAFRMADWGGHYDPANPRPPYEGTSMFQTKETLSSGTLRPGDDVRGFQLTFLQMYAGSPLTRIAKAYPDAFEMITRQGKDVLWLTQIPDELSNNIKPPLLKILTTAFENVSELQRAITEVYLALEQ